MEYKVKTLGDTRDLVGESPIWDARSQALYWVDIDGKHIRKFDPRSGKTDTWNTPQRVGCIVLRKDGGLVAAMESAIFSVNFENPLNISYERIAVATHPQQNMRFNDGACDRQGRFWVGTMSMDPNQPVGEIYRFDSNGLNKTGIDGLVTCNGLAFSPKGDKMYLSDSNAEIQLIWEFDYDVVNGIPHNRRIFVDMKKHPGRPDGAAIDADGGYWICGNDAGEIHRFTPDGRLDRSISVPVPKPSKCTFGGSQLDTMYITSIIPNNSKNILDGAVFALNPGVKGIEESGFEFD